jgi:hypothetical protein
MNKIEIQIAGRYFLLLQQKKLAFEQIAPINSTQARILLLPLIINLIHQGSLTFSTAKSLHPSLRSLFCSNSYMDYFSKEKINWEKMALLTPEDCNLLLDEHNSNGIAELIKNNIFAISDTYLFPKNTRQYLKALNIRYLLLQKIISLDELNELKSNTVELINTHPHFLDWILTGLVQVSEID